jgi:hypothetical protein
MTMNPSWKLPEVFVLKYPQVIRIHFSEWEVVVVVCRPRRGVRIITAPLSARWQATCRYQDVTEFDIP